MSPLIKALSISSAVGAGLIAGTFFIFSAVIMPALAKGNPDHDMQTMRTINEVILRSPFMFVFGATALLGVLLPVLAGVNRSPQFGWLVAAGALYLVGVFGVTAVFNVPLNDRLMGNGLISWSDYLRLWVPWNHVRTLAAAASMLCSILAPVLQSARL